MKKKLGGFFGALAAIAAAVVVAHNTGGSKPRGPAPAATYMLTVHVFRGDPAGDHKLSGAAVDSAEFHTVTDGAGNTWLNGLPAGPRSVCAALDGYERACADVTMPSTDLDISLTPPAPLFVSLPPLSTSGPIFLEDGQPWRYKGVTAFGLLNRFAKGEDIGPFLAAYRGFNVLRVFCYVPVKDWGAAAWDTPSVDVIRAYLARVAHDGFRVELTLLTDDDPARGPPAKALIAALAQDPRPTGLLLEAGNEPRTHKAIDTAALRGALDASGFLYASGDYEDSARMFGRYGVAHTSRDVEWPRRAHDLLEFYSGGGPNSPSDPAHKIPIVADEPAKLQDVGGDRALDWRSYFAAVSVLGAGGTFHSETGKTGLPPTGDEAALAAIALEALSAFPADAPKGPYSRPDEGAATLRTYKVGPYVVRIRPTDGKVIQ